MAEENAEQSKETNECFCQGIEIRFLDNLLLLYLQLRAIINIRGMLMPGTSGIVISTLLLDGIYRTL